MVTKGSRAVCGCRGNCISSKWLSGCRTCMTWVDNCCIWCCLQMTYWWNMWRMPSMMDLWVRQRSLTCFSPSKSAVNILVHISDCRRSEIIRKILIINQRNTHIQNLIFINVFVSNIFSRHLIGYILKHATGFMLVLFILSFISFLVC